MGCLASKQATTSLPAAGKEVQAQQQDTLATLATWDSLACDPACAKWLKDNGISLETAQKLTQQGVQEQGDLELLSPKAVAELGLNRVQAKKLGRLLQGSGKQEQAAPVASSISKCAHGAPTQAAGQPPAADAGMAGKPLKEALLVTVHADEQLEAPHADLGHQLEDYRDDKGLLTTLCRKGLAWGAPALTMMTKVLPSPGKEAAEALATVLEHCNSALTNTDNIQPLVERCTDLMGLLVGQLEPAATGEGVAYTEKYHKQMGKFRNALLGVEHYCHQYTKKAWWLRAVSSAADKEEYEGLVKKIDEIVEDALFGLELESHSFVSVIRQKIDYNVIPELRKMEEELETLTATLKRGHHDLIKQRDLRAFWQRHSSGQERMSWQLWWSYFPESMKEWLRERDYEELCTLLGTDEARLKFQKAVEQHDSKYISVDELMCRFNVNRDLVPRVRKLLEKSADALGTTASGTIAPSTSTTAAGTAAAAAAEGSSGLVSVLSDRPFTAKCDLPDLDPMYCGRDAAAQHVLSLLTCETSPARAVLLLGDGGLGKSSLAVDVGWQLCRAGLLPGGAAMVNLTGAATETQQLQRFCTALGILHDEGALPRLLARLGSLPAAHHLLLVLDSAEDCLEGPGAPAFTQLAAKVMRSSPAVRLLITSRVAWPSTSSISAAEGLAGEPFRAGAVAALPDYHEYQVPPLDQAPEAALGQLLHQLCSEDVLPAAQLQPVLDACGGSPLPTRLVADALTNGRLAAQDVTASAGSQPGGAVQLVLASLQQEQLQQLARLAVFPCTFDEEDAAAILGCLPSQAQTPLDVLRTHSLLLYDAMNQQHYLHTAVKQQAVVLAGPQLLQDTREAFVRLMLARLADWAALYQTKSFARALLLLEQQAANVDELWGLVSECNLQQGAMQQVAAAMSNDLRLLLLAGHKFSAAKPAWRRLEQCTFSESALHANALTYAAYADGLHTKQAEVKLRTALDMRQRVLGQEHLDTITSTCNLASCMEAMGQYADAEPMLRTGLEVRQRVLGQGHPDTISSLNDLAICLKAMGQHSEAEPMFRTALKERQRVLGPDHPDTTCSSSNLASCLGDMGQHAPAEPMFRTA